GSAGRRGLPGDGSRRTNLDHEPRERRRAHQWHPRAWRDRSVASCARAAQPRGVFPRNNRARNAARMRYPMTFLRALHAETLKMRRTIAWKMAILAPGIVGLLAFFAAWQAPFSTIKRFGPNHEWEALTRFCMRFWAILMLPLYIMLQS